MPTNVIRYQLRSHAKTLIVMYAIVCVVCILLFSSVALSSSGNGSVAVSGGVVSIGGLGLASAITLLVIGTSAVTEDLPLLLSCGISRKTQFRAKVVALLVTVLCMAALEMAFSLTASLFMPYRSMFMQMEGIVTDSSFGWGGADYTRMYQVGTIVKGIAWTAMLYMFTFSIGFFFAAMFQRIPRTFKPYAIVGTVLLFIWGLPKPDALTNHALFRIVKALVGQTTLRHTLFFAGCAAVLLAAGYVLFRRAQVVAQRK